MNQPTQATDQNTREQQLQQFVFDDFKNKVTEGIIKFVKKEGKVFLSHRNLDSLQKVTEPILMEFSSTQLAKIRIARRRQRDDLELQLLALKDEIKRRDKEDEDIYAVLEPKIAELEDEPTARAGGEK